MLPFVIGLNKNPLCFFYFSCRITEIENWGLQIHHGCDIIFMFQFGGLAQLVRAPASHAGGLGFESLILHHTVRTRTQFFTKKGSGTFFVYRKFCGRTTRNGKRAKAGDHYDGGILPFVLRDQVRFVRTWSSPYMTHWGQSLCMVLYNKS